MTGTGARLLATVAAILIAVYAIHWVIEMISFAAIGTVVFSDYQRMRGKFLDEKRKTDALRSELNRAKLLLESNGLLEDDEERKPFLERTR